MEKPKIWIFFLLAYLPLNAQNIVRDDSPGSQSRTSVPINGLPATNSKFSILRNEILGWVKNGELPSVSVAVFKDGHILWKESIGWANVEENTPATPHTPYGIASLGKSLTASAILVLVNQGKIDLDAPVSNYLGDSAITVFEGTRDQVTVRRILNMTAGIPHGYATFSKEEDRVQYSANMIKNRGIVVFPPGEFYMYSNFSFAILEKLIERVSGENYQEFMATEVFTPLGMSNSFVAGEDESSIKFKPAARYANGSLLSNRYPLPFSSLAMYSSLDDLLNFAMFQLNVKEFKKTKIFGESLLEKMQRLRGEAPHSNLALGLGSGDLDSKRLFLLTNGNAGGIQSTLLMIPSEKLAVVCLINSSNQSSDGLAFQITDQLIPGFQRFLHGRISNYKNWASSPYKPTTDLIGEWKGYVKINEGQDTLKLLFQPDGDIHVQIGNQIKTILDNSSFRFGLLSGEFVGEIKMEDSADHPTILTISLMQKGNRLFGFINSTFTNQKGNYSISTYASLKKL